MKRIISLTNTTVDMEPSLNAHRNEKCGCKLHTCTDELVSAKMEITQKYEVGSTKSDHGDSDPTHKVVFNMECMCLSGIV